MFNSCTGRTVDFHTIISMEQTRGHAVGGSVLLNCMSEQSALQNRTSLFGNLKVGYLNTIQ